MRCSVRWQAHRVDLGESDQQQRTQVAVLVTQRSLQPELQRSVIACALAQGGEADGFEQGAVTRIGQLCQCGTAGDGRSVQPAQDLGESRAVGLRVRNLDRQGVHQGRFTLRRIAAFQWIEIGTHVMGSRI